ncbi:hypothetical protein [Rudaeicoccus suwonensis]|uniref:Pyridoxamine 5'-phosphate oxidase n=1 Tax=Rudaeicoccus suwonensis TaxID=657409 RepID=A0A561E157_9MICO|nr:hypothetical protein [Rudaeicoccus suwonensis]TWE09366.1 hypothetical protein BKA23_3068 [Rudaeicoccus suwonensis]
MDAATALAKSKIAWLVLPERTVPVWYAAAEGAAYVLSGPGEQRVPPLPATLQITLRDKDTRAAVGPLPARAITLAPHTPEWDTAVAALLAARQNTPTGDVASRWAQECTCWRIETDATSSTATG